MEEVYIIICVETAYFGKTIWRYYSTLFVYIPIITIKTLNSYALFIEFYV